MKNENSIKDTLFLFDFIKENSVSGQMTQEMADKIEALWDKYKLSTVDENCTIISADFGVLGCLEIRNIKESRDNNPLRYKSGDYDFVSVVCTTRKILWTDYKDIEPYNRQSGLYGGGSSFASLGKPIKETKDYREYDVMHENLSNISFGVWGFRFNDFYGSVTFGLCMDTKKVDEFITSLKLIIGK